MNDTPQGDGNSLSIANLYAVAQLKIRMNDTPQGDGNLIILSLICLEFGL